MPPTERDPERGLLTADPHAPDTLARRYEWYRALRQWAPVKLHPHADDRRRDLCTVARHQDVTAALTDPRFVRESNRPRYLGPDRPGAGSPFADAFAHWMVYRDPPHHARLRSPLHRALKVQTEGMGPVVEAVVAGLLGSIPAGTADLIPALAFPVPATVICHLTGLADVDLDTFRGWMAGLNRALERADDPKAWDEADRVTGEMAAAILAGLRPPRTDFLRSLLAALGDPPTLEEGELVGNLILFLFAGHETTLNLIANTIHCLLVRSSVRDRVSRQPDLVPRVVEEALRYEPAVQVTYRFAAEDVTLGGTAIPAGTRVALLLGSANRDEAVYERAESFDPFVERRTNLAFGLGAHFCTGAALGRLEAEVAVRGLLERFPRLIACDASPEWKPSLTYRAMRSLRVQGVG